MELTAEEIQAGWFEVDIIQSDLAGHGLKAGDVATFRPASRIKPGRIYAFEIDNPIPELRGYLLRLAIKDTGGKVLLYSAISTVEPETMKSWVPISGELVRVNGRVVSQIRC